MGKLKPRKPKNDLTRPATVGDLESLVRALGKIVGAGIEKAVHEALAEQLAETNDTLASMQTYLRALAKGEYLTGGPIGGALPVPIMMTDAERDEKAERDLGPGNAVR